MNMVYAVDGVEVITSVEEQDAQVLAGRETITQTAVEFEGEIVRDNSQLKVVEGVVEYDADAVAKADKEAQRIKAKQVKNDALNAMVVEIDGMSFQTTPNDLTNFNVAISKGGDHKWRLTNNTRAVVTTAQLQEVLSVAVIKSIEIEDAYTDTLPEFNSVN